MPTDGSFLGTGWGFPPTFTKGGAEVEMASGVEDVHQSLQILLSTRLGERVMQDDFGCDLSYVLFEEVDQGLINSLTSIISDAILYHEPRMHECLYDHLDCGWVSLTKTPSRLLMSG